MKSGIGNGPFNKCDFRKFIWLKMNLEIVKENKLIKEMKKVYPNEICGNGD